LETEFEKKKKRRTKVHTNELQNLELRKLYFRLNNYKYICICIISDTNFKRISWYFWNYGKQGGTGRSAL